MCLAGASAAATAPAEPTQPFSVQDMVRMERISDVAVAPDGKHVVYTQRTTDMEANKGRTSIWMLDTGKRGATPLRLTDGGPNSNSPEWSKDGKFIYFLSNRSGTNQVWRVNSNGTGPRGDTPVADSTQVTNLPLDVGSFRVSPKGDRILVSVEVFLDCADLPCTKKRLDSVAHSAATGVLHTQLFVRHWDAWSDGRRSQLFAMALNDNGVAQGTPVNLTGGIGDVPGKPFGGREDYAFNPDGTTVAFSVKASAGEAWSTNFRRLYGRRRRRRPAEKSHRRQQGVGWTTRILSRRLAACVRGHGSARFRGRSISFGAAQSAVGRQTRAHAELGSIDQQLCLVSRRQDVIRDGGSFGPAPAMGGRCRDRPCFGHHRRR